MHTDTIALTRAPSSQMADCELTFRDRSRIDMVRLRQQHDAYEMSLRAVGCDIVRVPMAPELPDSIFVEDTALVLPEVCVIMRPGAPSRRPETETVAAVMAAYRDVIAIEPPGTMDGGDVLVVGRSIYVGSSTRTNRAGFDQMCEIAKHRGYSVDYIDLSDCLHLKSAASLIAENTLLVNPRWCDAEALNHGLIYVAASEPDAANGLHINGSVIFPESFPKTANILTNYGIELEIVDVTEIQKAEGGVTCCSIVFES